MSELYKQELEKLKQGYHDIKSESKGKDDIVLKLTEIIREQEKYILHFKVKTQNDIDGRLTLFDFKDYTFTIEEERKEKLKFGKRSLLSKIDEDDVKELRDQIHSLEHELDSLTHMHEDLIYKWKGALIDNSKLEKENKEIVRAYEIKLSDARADCFKDEKRIRKELENSKSQFEEFKKEIMREIKLKEVINKRHESYEEILRKELTMAK